MSMSFFFLSKILGEMGGKVRRNSGAKQHRQTGADARCIQTSSSLPWNCRSLGLAIVSVSKQEAHATPTRELTRSTEQTAVIFQSDLLPTRVAFTTISPTLISKSLRQRKIAPLQCILLSCPQNNSLKPTCPQQDVSGDDGVTVATKPTANTYLRLIRAPLNVHSCSSFLFCLKYEYDDSDHMTRLSIMATKAHTMFNGFVSLIRQLLSVVYLACLPVHVTT